MGELSRGKKTAVIGAALFGGFAAYQLWKRSQSEGPHLLKGRNVIILGAGFAGSQVALELAKALPSDEDSSIILVDETNYLLFTPMLTEVASGQIEPSHIATPLRRLSPQVRFVQGRVDHIDLKKKHVTITLGDEGDRVPPKQRTLAADFMVIGLGSVTNFFNNDSLREHSFTMKSLGDAVALYNRILFLLERADAEPDAQTRRALLTFVIGGGGFSGVETMAAINDFVREASERYPRIQGDDIRMVIVHPRDRLLPELDESLARYAEQKLRERNVEIIFNRKITEAGVDFIEMDNGERITTYTHIWTAGVMPHPVIPTLDCDHNHRGAVKVNACCELLGYEGIWAVGDCAEVPKPDGTAYAPTAQNAIREGVCVGNNILAFLRGQDQKPFVYEPMAELALVGKRVGVARIYNFHFSGFFAWFLWRAVYLSKMPDAADRIRIGMDWLLDIVFGRETAQLMVTRAVETNENRPDLPGDAVTSEATAAVENVVGKA